MFKESSLEKQYANMTIKKPQIALKIENIKNDLNTGFFKNF